ncbi:DNA primase [Paenibacillus aurantius]|uniref:DNA primase n=1 Tax=Paenibacillus aurantius TaxID=2918900 RepID=A0AA96LEJ5_9BACL|nr:DNA primase [Paenibacillus aurantius]WNQ12609.1 DNA primase [Paenibacillus aurantius]
MEIAIIVEGKNDRSRLRRVICDEALIVMTGGTPGTEQLVRLRKQIGGLPVYIFTDNDASGKKIRAILSDAFPDAEQIYTRRGYAGVEGTPEEYLIQQLEKAGLEDLIIYPPLIGEAELRYELQKVDHKRHRKDAEHGRGKNSL